MFHLLMNGKGEVQRLSQGLEDLISKIKTCEVCQDFAESSPCAVCADASRDHTTVCVVAMPSNIPPIEKTGFKGVYHVLRGTLDPTEDRGPEALKIEELRKRPGVKEIILALNPDLDGEATMLYLKDLFKTSEIKISRLARGLPMGSDIEYTDEITLGDAFKNRKQL